jgi:hypothetical protein
MQDESERSNRPFCSGRRPTSTAAGSRQLDRAAWQLLLRRGLWSTEACGTPASDGGPVATPILPIRQGTLHARKGWSRRGHSGEGHGAQRVGSGRMGVLEQRAEGARTPSGGRTWSGMVELGLEGIGGATQGGAPPAKQVIHATRNVGSFESQPCHVGSSWGSGVRRSEQAEYWCREAQERATAGRKHTKSQNGRGLSAMERSFAALQAKQACARPSKQDGVGKRSPSPARVASCFTHRH